MDGQKITKSHEDKAIIPCQLSLLTQILTISMSRQLPSLCVTAIEGSRAQMFTQLTKARFPPGQKISLSLGFIFFEQFFWSYSSSNLKCAGLICIKQSQRAFDCPITKDCYQHTPSVLVHGGRQQFYQKRNFYQEFGKRGVWSLSVNEPLIVCSSKSKQHFEQKTYFYKEFGMKGTGGLIFIKQRAFENVIVRCPKIAIGTHHLSCWPALTKMVPHLVSFLFCTSGTSHSQSGSACTTQERE